MEQREFFEDPLENIEIPEFLPISGVGLILSSETDRVIPDFLAAQREMDNIGKNKRAKNEKYTWDFPSLGAALDHIRPILNEHNFAITQPAEVNGLVVTITTLLLHDSGQFIGSRFSVTSKEPTAHAIASANTYARRYGLLNTLGLAPKDDDDGNRANFGNKSGATITDRTDNDGDIQKLKTEQDRFNRLLGHRLYKTLPQPLQREVDATSKNGVLTNLKRLSELSLKLENAYRSEKNWYSYISGLAKSLKQEVIDAILGAYNYKKIGDIKRASDAAVIADRFEWAVRHEKDLAGWRKKYGNSAIESACKKSFMGGPWDVSWRSDLRSIQQHNTNIQSFLE